MSNPSGDQLQLLRRGTEAYHTETLTKIDKFYHGTAIRGVWVLYSTAPPACPVNQLFQRYSKSISTLWNKTSIVLRLFCTDSNVLLNIRCSQRKWSGDGQQLICWRNRFPMNQPLSTDCWRACILKFACLLNAPTITEVRYGTFQVSVWSPRNTHKKISGVLYLEPLSPEINLIRCRFYFILFRSDSGGPVKALTSIVNNKL